MSKQDTGFKMLARASKFNFLKWGQYMKRAQLAERKVEKMKRLILLTDESVGNIEMNDVTVAQWQAFIAEFPDEA